VTEREAELILRDQGMVITVSPDGEYTVKYKGKREPTFKTFNLEEAVTTGIEMAQWRRK